MSHDDNTLTNKLSPLIGTQLPEFIQSDHPVFSEFVKTYYQFLESAEVTFSEVNNYLIQETTSKNFVFDENGDNIVLEDSEAKFTVGETITGRDSGATAVVLVDDVDDNKRLFITSQTQFIIGEVVNGSLSNSSGTIQTYRANPVQNIQQLLELANIDSTITKFLDNFRDSFLDGVVDNLVAGVDKRKLTKNIRDLYISKGTRKGHELFFRLLFNEDATITYPNENMLRTSDGAWTTRLIMRVQEISGDVTELIGQTVLGRTSGATGIPVSTISIRENFTDIVEIEIDTDTQTGTFQAGETLTGTSSVTDQDVSFQIYSIVVNADVSNDDEGQYYTSGQTVNIQSAGSTTATAEINTVGSGSVNSFVIDNAGRNYAIGDTINFNNLGTDGTGISAEVQVVGGAISAEAGDGAEYGMTVSAVGSAATGEEDHIVLEDETQIFMGDSYHGTKIVLEDATFNDIGTNQTATSGQPHFDAYGSHSSSIANERGAITDIRLINGGNGYTKLPVVQSITTTSGVNGIVLPISTSGIGSVQDVKITNFGFNYNSAPTFIPFRHAIVKSVTGAFGTGDTLTSHAGTVSAFDSTRQLLSLNTTANLSVGNTVTTAGASAVIAQIDTPTITPSVGTLATTSGEFLGERGKVSSDVMRIQDSFYYQDYSYVVKVGESINTWRNAIKRTVHPAGWAVFGEVSIVSSVTAGIRAFAAGDLTAPEGTVTPELASLLKTVFTTIFGRRLGTVDDGTTLRATPQLASDAILSSGERDVTLSKVTTVFVGVIRANPVNVGSTLDNLAKYAFAVEPIESSATIPNYPGITRDIRVGNNERAYYNIEQFGKFRINQVSTRSLDSDTFDDTTLSFDSDSEGFDANDISVPLEAFTTRINVPPPGEIQISSTATTSNFSDTFITFDDGNNEFSESGASSATPTVTDFSETGITFDTSAETFDEEVSGVPVDFSTVANTFDQTTATFDDA